jgi:pimeloyl-ACP methyl ester carboxylesterase
MITPARSVSGHATVHGERGAPPDPDITSARRDDAAMAAIFVHGFLDDRHVWDPILEQIADSGRFSTVSVDLAGTGERRDATGPFSYDRFAADVCATVDSIDKPFVIIGQSMGAAIAELVATARPELVRGLVLLTPVPLAGTHLPDEAIEPFRSIGSQGPAANRAARLQLSPSFPEPALSQVVSAGDSVRPEVVRAWADCWNSGHPDGSRPSRYAGPTLVLRGAEDAFVTEELIASSILPRFADTRQVVVEHTGHWPHAERPAVVADHINRFLRMVSENRTEEDAPPVTGQGERWTGAFAAKSAAQFAEAFADDIVLEASALATPVAGREQVMQVMGTASTIYESLEFTREATDRDRTYLEWTATAFGGMTLRGVTILTRNDQGQIVHAAIHHRPLGAALRFSAELRERLHGLIDSAHFYQG